MPAVAITDQNNLFAMVKFYKSAESAGIKPIIGVDVWLAPRLSGEPPERLTLLVQNDGGYRNLAKLLSAAYTEGQGTGRSEARRVGKECAVRVDLGGRRIINKKKKKNTK